MAARGGFLLPSPTRDFAAIFRRRRASPVMRLGLDLKLDARLHNSVLRQVWDTRVGQKDTRKQP